MNPLQPSPSPSKVASGTGDYDFRAVLQALKDLAYPGRVSLEVFHFEHGPENIARDSARFIRDLEKKLVYDSGWGLIRSSP